MKEFVDELIMCPKCGAEGSVRWEESLMQEKIGH